MSEDVNPEFIPILLERLILEERLKRITFRDQWGFTPQHISPMLENLEAVTADYQSWKSTNDKLCYYIEINSGHNASGVGRSGDGY